MMMMMMYQVTLNSSVWQRSNKQPHVHRNTSVQYIIHTGQHRRHRRNIGSEQ